MNEICFVDTTLRDAHQSMWGNRMPTAMAYETAPMIDRAGYKALDAAAPAQFVFLIRYFRENPWERLRLLRERITNTQLSVMVLGSTLVTFNPMKGPVMELWMQRCIANGLRRVQMMDASNNIQDISESARFAKEAGLELVVPLIFSITPVHTDEYYVEKARDAVKIGADAIYVKDSGGLLTPDRIQTLIPLIRDNIDGKPLELHSHCTTGLAPLCYLEAVKNGVRTVHTACEPLANGSSLPSAENILMNIRRLGFTDNLDLEAIGAVGDYFRTAAAKEGLPTGTPVEYDLRQYDHQIPGGVISNLRRQLTDMGQEGRFDEIVEESIRVRKDLGYPIMVTPFSQYVVTQATINVILGERYKEIVDEVTKLALGVYGRQAGDVDQNLLDKVRSSPKAKDYLNWQVPRPTLKELRKEYGMDVSDDELLLRILCQGQDDVTAMHSAGPIKTQYSEAQRPLIALIKDVLNRKRLTHVYVSRDNYSFRLRKLG